MIRFAPPPPRPPLPGLAVITVASSSLLVLEAGCDGPPRCAQVLHLVRAHSQAEFQVAAEEAQLPSKLHDLERLCEEQGIRPDGSQAPT